MTDNLRRRMIAGCVRVVLGRSASSIFDTLDAVLFVRRPLLLLWLRRRRVAVGVLFVQLIRHHGYPVEGIAVLTRAINAEVALQWLEQLVDHV
jgi:hypothetical protein